MKAEGADGSAEFVRKMIGELGLDDKAQKSFIGEKPSYSAQMELLTRRLYQVPSFYANLMESNANVARQQTAMEGIALMQDRDIYESLRRSELVMSALLEMYIIQEQSAYTDRGVK